MMRFSYAHVKHMSLFLRKRREWKTLLRKRIVSLVKMPFSSFILKQDKWNDVRGIRQSKEKREKEKNLNWWIFFYLQLFCKWKFRHVILFFGHVSSHAWDLVDFKPTEDSHYEKSFASPVWLSFFIVMQITDAELAIWKLLVCLDALLSDLIKEKFFSACCQQCIEIDCQANLFQPKRLFFLLNVMKFETFFYVS